MNKILLSIGIYYIFINLLAFVMNWTDKIKAQRQSRRISERTLHILALIGGVWGALGAMFLAHHKTKKRSFYVVTIFITILNIGYIVGAVYCYLNYL